MPDYPAIVAICKKVNTLSKDVLDDFLIPYAARRQGLEREMDQRLSRFKAVMGKIHVGTINMFKAQYIAHRIFRKGGLIGKYLHDSSLKSLPAEHISYLSHQYAVPWRFSFSFIIGFPETHLFEMQDVFTGETFLLYSPGITKISQEARVMMWFNLISFNGSCWQTYGPIVHFQGCEPDDIFFFASSVNPRISSEEDLMENVDENPFPYLMLSVGSNYPVTYTGDDEILQLVAEHEIEVIDQDKLPRSFTIEHEKGIYRFQYSKWAQHPHFANAYFDSRKKILLLSALTERGFKNMVKAFNKYGLDLPIEPDVRVHMSMLFMVKDILGKNENLNPYEKLFDKEEPKGENDHMKGLNNFLSMAIPLINEGKKLDIDALAAASGIDPEEASAILEHAMKRIKNLQKNAGNRHK